MFAKRTSRQGALSVVAVIDSGHRSSFVDEASGLVRLSRVRVLRVCVFVYFPFICRFLHMVWASL